MLWSRRNYHNLWGKAERGFLGDREIPARSGRRQGTVAGQETRLLRPMPNTRRGNAAGKAVAAQGASPSHSAVTWQGVPITPRRVAPWRTTGFTTDSVGAAINLEEAHFPTSEGRLTSRGRGARPCRSVGTAASILLVFSAKDTRAVTVPPA